MGTRTPHRSLRIPASRRLEEPAQTKSGSALLLDEVRKFHAASMGGE